MTQQTLFEIEEPGLSESDLRELLAVWQELDADLERALSQREPAEQEREPRAS